MEAKITVSKDGPYNVTGGVPISIETIGTDAAGDSDEWAAGSEVPVKANYALCRCGESKTKPFCDGTHAKIGFDGTETATRATQREQSTQYPGPLFILDDAEKLCSYARFCDRAGTIWKLMPKTADPDIRATVEFEAAACPSGRLVLRDVRTDATLEPDFEPSIVLVEDPSRKASGPLWVRGRIPIASADGTPYEVRNRVALCRCGASRNKPFCDGTHDETKFEDGLSSEPA